MNPKTSLTHAQIAAVFRKHGLAQYPTITRITVGFTNEVYQVDDYILKICVKPDNEPSFRKEAFLYKLLQDQAPVPRLVVAGNTRSLLPHIYMIYKKLPGEPVANHWHEMTDSQRKQFIGELCGYLKIIDNLPPSSYSRNEKLGSFDWQKHICDRIEVKLAIIGERKLLPETTVSSIQQFVAQTKHVLEAQKLGLVFWDVHFDNLLVDEKFALAGLIDLESTDVCSIDYRLMTVRLMQRHPKLYLSKEMESYAKTKDYTHLLKWYRDFYPDMFAFEHIDARIDLYELLDIVSKLPDWPRATILRQRLKNTLG